MKFQLDFVCVQGGAHLNYDYQPDIAVFSKALGNGYPIGAIIGKGQVMDAAEKSFLGNREDPIRA